MNLIPLKSVNNGHDVMRLNHYERLREIDGVIRLVGPSAPLNEIAKYFLRIGWESLGCDNRTFMKEGIKLVVPSALEHLPSDTGHQALVVWAQSYFAHSFSFLNQLTQVAKGMPMLVVVPCGLFGGGSAIEGKAWVNADKIINGRCGLVCIRNVFVFYNERVPSDDEVIKCLGDLYEGDDLGIPGKKCGISLMKSALERALGSGFVVTRRPIRSDDDFMKLMAEGCPVVAEDMVIGAPGFGSNHVILLVPDGDGVVVVDANKKPFHRRVSLETAKSLPVHRGPKEKDGGISLYNYQISKKQ